MAKPKTEGAAARADALIAKYGSTGHFAGPRCSVATHPERELIDAMLARKVQFNHLERTITSEFPNTPRVSAQVLSRHAARVCQCPK